MSYTATHYFFNYKITTNEQPAAKKLKFSPEKKAEPSRQQATPLTSFGVFSRENQNSPAQQQTDRMLVLSIAANISNKME